MRLKALLGTVPSEDWQRAQRIMQELCLVCGVKGPSGAMMVPRACRWCGFYGHSRQFCPSYRAHRERLAERELAQDPARGWRRPESRQECASDEEWEWVCTLKRINERVEEGRRLGKGCTSGREVQCAGDIDLHCACDGCREWRQWMGSEACLEGSVDPAALA